MRIKDPRSSMAAKILRTQKKNFMGGTWCQSHPYIYQNRWTDLDQNRTNCTPNGPMHRDRAISFYDNQKVFYSTLSAKSDFFSQFFL